MTSLVLEFYAFKDFDTLSINSLLMCLLPYIQMIEPCCYDNVRPTIFTTKTSLASSFSAM